MSLLYLQLCTLNFQFRITPLESTPIKWHRHRRLPPQIMLHIASFFFMCTCTLCQWERLQNTLDRARIENTINDQHDQHDKYDKHDKQIKHDNKIKLNAWESPYTGEKKATRINLLSNINKVDCFGNIIHANKKMFLSTHLAACHDVLDIFTTVARTLTTPWRSRCTNYQRKYLRIKDWGTQ